MKYVGVGVDMAGFTNLVVPSDDRVKPTNKEKRDNTGSEIIDLLVNKESSVRPLFTALD